MDETEFRSKLVAVLTMIEARLGEIAATMGGMGMPDSSQAQHDRYEQAVKTLMAGTRQTGHGGLVHREDGTSVWTGPGPAPPWYPQQDAHPYTGSPQRGAAGTHEEA